MPPHSATERHTGDPWLPAACPSTLHLQPRATGHSPCPSNPPPCQGPAAPIAWARPWVSLTLTLLTSESKSKSRDVETRQSRPSLAELSWSTCPLILFNFIASLLGCWLLPFLFPRLRPSHTFTLICILVLPSAPQAQPIVSAHKPATPAHIPTPLTRAGFLHRTIYT